MGYGNDEIEGIVFVDYNDEAQLDSVMSLVGRDLSEPYSIFTYRYFLQRFPQLCILACPADKPNEPIGCVVGKIDIEKVNTTTTTDSSEAGETTTTSSFIEEKTGYIGMLAVMASHRRLGIGTSLVKQVLKRMRSQGCISVTLETEVSNAAAQRLYQDTFGFLREELLVRYYLNWGDAYRLRLWLCLSKKKQAITR